MAMGRKVMAAGGYGSESEGEVTMGRKVKAR